jgi:hypothetical protein
VSGNFIFFNAAQKIGCSGEFLGNVLQDAQNKFSSLRKFMLQKKII